MQATPSPAKVVASKADGKTGAEQLLRRIPHKIAIIAIEYCLISAFVFFKLASELIISLINASFGKQ